MKYVKTFERFALNENHDFDFSDLPKYSPDEIGGMLYDEEIKFTPEQKKLVDEFFKLEGDVSKLDRKVVGSESYNKRIEILKKLGADTSEFEQQWAEFDKHEGF
jgi:hypothetical protein